MSQATMTAGYRSADLRPEELRWRGGAWRVVPRGTDKDVVTKWIAEHMSLEDYERRIYLLCVPQRRLGMPIPRDDLMHGARSSIPCRRPAFR
jgi:hypothetical protein